MVLQVRCPQCRMQVPYEGNPHRPFCSERCRLIDLGLWASDGYAIPGTSLEVDEKNPSEEKEFEEGTFPLK